MTASGPFGCALEAAAVTNDTRTPGKGGRLPRDPERHIPLYETYLMPGSSASSVKLTPLTVDIDRSSKVFSIPVYLNDQLGDCTIAALAHFFSGMSVFSGYPEPLFSDAVITSAYSAVGGYKPGDPSTDKGADMQTVLEFARSTGLVDTTGKTHKVVAYSLIGNPADEHVRGTVLDIFGTVYDGWALTQAQEDQFSQGVPWDWDAASPQIGGHCTCQQRRFPVGTLGVNEQWTWGARQRSTFAFAAHQCEESYMVVSEDWIRSNGTTVEGYALQALLSDMEAVH
jgi:hypothetical protein